MRTTESAVRSRSEKMRVSRRVDAGSAPLVGQVDEPHLLDEGLRDVLEQPAHQVGVGVHDDDGVSVPALGLLPHLVGDDVVHQGGLAHAGAGDVEVVASQQVVGEVNLPGRSGGGVADVGAAADAAGGGQQHPGPGAGHQWRLVPWPPAGATGRPPRGRPRRCASRTGRGLTGGALRGRARRAGRCSPSGARPRGCHSRGRRRPTAPAAHSPGGAGCSGAGIAVT